MKAVKVVRVRTRKEAQRWFFGLVGALAAIQLILDAFAPFLGRYQAAAMRLTGALVVGIGAILFEMYKARRGAS